MIEDEVIQEIRRARNEIAKSFNYDFKAISKYFQELETTENREEYSTPAKKKEKQKTHG